MKKLSLYTIIMMSAFNMYGLVEEVEVYPVPTVKMPTILPMQPDEYNNLQTTYARECNQDRALDKPTCQSLHNLLDYLATCTDISEKLEKGSQGLKDAHEVSFDMVIQKPWNQEGKRHLERCIANWIKNHDNIHQHTITYAHIPATQQYDKSGIVTSVGYESYNINVKLSDGVKKKLVRILSSIKSYFDKIQFQ